MIYIINGYSKFDYEIKNVVFGVFDDKKQAEYHLQNLEKMQKEKGNDEMILYITKQKINYLVDENIKTYLVD